MKIWRRRVLVNNHNDFSKNLKIDVKKINQQGLKGKEMRPAVFDTLKEMEVDDINKLRKIVHLTEKVIDYSTTSNIDKVSK